MYVVVSNLDVGCEMKDVYDRKEFLQANLPKLVPKLPLTEKDQDYVAVLMYQRQYDPRRVQAPPLVSLITGAPGLQRISAP